MREDENIKGETHSTIRIGAVLFLSIAVTLLMVFFALVILLRRQEILQGIVLPLASIYAPDGVIEIETRVFIDKLFNLAVPLILLIGLLTFLYGFFWDFFSNSLVVHRPVRTERGTPTPFSIHERISVVSG
jgi:hypothetical protein